MEILKANYDLVLTAFTAGVPLFTVGSAFAVMGGMGGAAVAVLRVYTLWVEGDVR
jgi:hypothetical protein